MLYDHSRSQCSVCKWTIFQTVSFILWFYDCICWPSYMTIAMKFDSVAEIRPESLKVSPLHRLQWSLTCFSLPWSWPTIKLELSTSTQPEMTPITSSGWFKCVVFFFTIHLCHVRLKIYIVFCFCPHNIQHPLKIGCLFYLLLSCSVQFRTTPMDSTGVPHILEHTVLCGSEKYPCRDPFFKMLTRSLSTFMNAFTGNKQ